MKDKLLEAAERFGIGKKEIKNVCIVLTVLLLVCFIIIIFESGGGTYVKEIERPAFGEADTVTNLVASIEGETYEVSANVKSKELTGEEKDEMFQRAREELERKLLGKNKSASRIVWPLDINATSSVSGVESFFQITDYSLIKYDGTLVYGEGFENDTHTIVKLILKIGDDERIYDIDLYLYRPAENEVSNESLIESEIAVANEDRSSASLVLPENVNGKDVSFSIKKSSILGGVVFLGIAAMMICLYLPYKKKKDGSKKRAEELEYGYFELTSKLSVLVGAGLSVKNAFEKIYDDHKRENTKENEALYEEVHMMMVSIEGGLLENEALMKFAERTELAVYQRLVSQIISNRKNGASKLKDFLSGEAEDAFEKRLMLAKRRGEKISSKLLVPMIILFTLILLLLIIPAFLSW